MYEKRVVNLEIENQNEELSLDFSFEKVPYFSFDNIDDQTLAPQQKISILVIFHPNSIGKFSSYIGMFLINGSYKVLK